MFGLTPYTRNQLQGTNGDSVGFYNVFDDLINDRFYNTRSIQNNAFRVDVRDEEDSFIIEADMPGIKKEDIKLDYKDGRLMLSVEQSEEVTDENENYIHRERRFSSMKRAIYLKDIDATKIDATLVDGVLKVEVPKLESAKDQLEIEVK